MYRDAEKFQGVPPRLAYRRFGDSRNSHKRPEGRPKPRYLCGQGKTGNRPYAFHSRRRRGKPPDVHGGAFCPQERLAAFLAGKFHDPGNWRRLNRDHAFKAGTDGGGPQS